MLFRSANNPNIQFITISLPPGSYNGPELESAPQLALNTYNDFPHGQDRSYNYTVQWNPVTEVISILPDSRATGVVSGVTNGFKLLTAKDKNTEFSSTFGTNNKPSQLDGLLGNTGMNSPLYTNSSKYKSQRVDFGLIKYLFLKSPNLGTFQNNGQFGGENDIQKILSHQGQGR